MCCRYYYDESNVNGLLEELGVVRSCGGGCPAGVITPGRESLMITGGQNRLQASVAVWGFPGSEGKTVINARSETAPVKPMFRDSLATRRCLLPAECFYEWDRDKNKVTFASADAPVIYLAGIWSLYGGEMRFVVLTTAANASMAPVHDRMPLMVNSGDIRPWLSDTAFARAYLIAEMPFLRAEREYEQMSLF